MDNIISLLLEYFYFIYSWIEIFPFFYSLQNLCICEPLKKSGENDAVAILFVVKEVYKLKAEKKLNKSLVL